MPPLGHHLAGFKGAGARLPIKRLATHPTYVQFRRISPKHFPKQRIHTNSCFQELSQGHSLLSGLSGWSRVPSMLLSCSKLSSGLLCFCVSSCLLPGQHPLRAFLETLVAFWALLLEPRSFIVTSAVQALLGAPVICYASKTFLKPSWLFWLS